jgi:hypothetical protein
VLPLHAVGGQLSGKYRRSQEYNLCEMKQVLQMSDKDIQTVTDIDAFEKAIYEYKKYAGMAIGDLGSYGIMPGK